MLCVLTPAKNLCIQKFLTMIRTYTELMSIPSFEERYKYLALKGSVGRETFGYDRWLNQVFYKSSEWQNARQIVMIRDEGCDLGVTGYDIGAQILIHHINPIKPQDLETFNPDVLDPEYLITTTLTTHNAIHYGDEGLLPRLRVARTPGDTKLW